ncbi:MAG: O-antigen ligase family protein [Candidatus Gastranaerophilaceae bacterium]|jgi:O-antigen ligase
MVENTKNSIVIDFIKNKQTLGSAWSVFGFVSVLFLSAVAFYLHIELYVLGAVIGLLYSYLIITSPKFWLYSIAVSSGIFFHSSSEGVSVLDLLLGALYLGSLTIWFIWQIFFLRKKVVRNLGDWLVLSFFFFLIFNFLIAYLNNSDLNIWMKEYLMFSIVLIYFPLRSIIKTEKELLKFLGFYSLIIIAAGIFQIFLYYNRLTEDFVYAYEMKSGININQTLYTSASIFGFLFTFHQTNKKNELLVLAFTAMAIISLIATFSRTFWVVLALAIVIFFIIFPIRKKNKMLIYIFCIVGLFAVIGYLFIPDKMYLLINVIGIRFSSSADGTKDLSVVARLMEWEQVIKKIFENPLGGNGLAKTFHFYNVIETRTSFTDIIHNGFLYITYRAGIPTALLYFSFIIFYTIKAWDNLVRSTSNYLKALSLSNFAVMIALYIVNFTSPQFFYRDGIFVTAFVVAFISINEDLLKIKHKNLDTNHG